MALSLGCAFVMEIRGGRSGDRGVHNYGYCVYMEAENVVKGKNADDEDATVGDDGIDREGGSTETKTARGVEDT